MSEVTGPGYRLIRGDCLEVLPGLVTGSVDAVITDPPYAEIDRPYGRLTESQWWELMMGVCTEVRRVLKPTGSAVFIIQPNSRKVGSMRGWVFEFMAWVCREWNMIQDAYWWNNAALPTGAATMGGLMRASVKPCVWAGASDCYRNQSAALWPEAEGTRARVDAKIRRIGNNGTYGSESGHRVNVSRIADASSRRGGVTPFNLFPTGTNSGNGNEGHCATTPPKLADWWARYICPPGGLALDPFCGSGTMGIAAMKHGARFIGIERSAEYHAIAARRIAAAAAQPPLIPHAEFAPAPVQAGLLEPA